MLLGMDIDLLALGSRRDAGIFTAAQALTQGLSRRQIADWVRDGRVVRLRSGVYVESSGTTLDPPPGGSGSTSCAPGPRCCGSVTRSCSAIPRPL